MAKEKIMMPSEYSRLSPGPFDLSQRLASYQDMTPYFPILHIDEVHKDGRLADAVYDDTYGVVLAQDFRAGAGFFINSPDLRYYSQGAADQLHSSLAGILAGVRLGERLVFNWMVWDEIAPVLGGYAKLKADDPAIVKYLRTRRWQREQQRVREGKLRQFSLACTIQVPFHGKVMESPVSGVAGHAFDFLHSIFGAFSMLKAERLMAQSGDVFPTTNILMDRVQALQRSFATLRGISVSPMHSTDYVRMTRRMLSPDWWSRIRGTFEAGDFSGLDGVAPVAAQLVAGRYADYGSYFTSGTYYHRVLTIEVPPSFVEMGFLMQAATAPDVLSTSGNLQITLVLEPRSREKELAAMRQRHKLLAKQIRFNPEKTTHLVEPFKQITDQINALENDERSSLFSSVLVAHLWDQDPNRLVRAEEALVRSVNTKTTSLMIGEELEALPYLLANCVPGCPVKNDSHRKMAATHEEVAPLIPLMGLSAGILNVKMAEPPIPNLLESDMGTPFCIDLFARGFVNAFNGIWVGGTGSGKSFLANYIFSSYCNRKTRVFIIDAAVGAPAYKQMAKLFGGVYVDKNFRFNALATKMKDGMVLSPDEEEMQGIMSTLDAMLQESAASVLQRSEKSMLAGAVNELFAHRPEGGAPYLRHLPDVLERMIQPTDPLYDQSRQFSRILRTQWCTPGGDNQFARFVDGPDDIEKSWLTVFDLKSYLEKPDLLSVFMTLIFRYIGQVVDYNLTLPESEREQIIVATDEGWKALFKPNLADIYLGLYKAGRSRNVSAHLLTQDFNDFLMFMRRIIGDGDEIQTSPIITQSSHFFVANIDHKEAEKIGETLNIPESQWGRMSGLKQVDGKYSEYTYLCRAKGSSNLLFTKFAYMPLIEELWAFSSSSDDDAARMTMLAEIVEDLSNPTTRASMLKEMGQGGWDAAALENLREDALAAHIMIARKSGGLRKVA